MAMSGHSHFATIKRQKESKDETRGKIFSKMARLITIAVKTGGGPNIDGNYKLQAVVEKARSFNMPKDNIERAINRAGAGANLEEITYEGFGPGGSSVIVEVATDNKNRTVAQIKGILEKGGGGLGSPGSALYNFESKGLVLVEKEADLDSQILKLIDLGAEDVEVTEDGIEVWVLPNKLVEEKGVLAEAHQKVRESELVLRPKNHIVISDSRLAEKMIAMLEALEDHDDVQRVYANVDFPVNTLN